MKDRCELVETKRGWRFRFLKAAGLEPVLISNGLYATAERCREVAKVVDRDCFGGAYMQRVRTLKRA